MKNASEEFSSQFFGVLVKDIAKVESRINYSSGHLRIQKTISHHKCFCHFEATSSINLVHLSKLFINIQNYSPCHPCRAKNFIPTVNYFSGELHITNPHSVGYGGNKFAKSNLIIKKIPWIGPPVLKVLEGIMRRMCTMRPIQINDLTLTAVTKRGPRALSGNGLLWYASTVDHERQRLSDFMRTRFSKFQKLDEAAVELELLAADEQWARMVDMTLAPHPGNDLPKPIRAENAMEEGSLRIKAMAALAGSLLRRWNGCAPGSPARSFCVSTLIAQNADSFRGRERRIGTRYSAFKIRACASWIISRKGQVK